MPWDNLEDAFKELEAREFAFLASCLGALRKSLMSEGFTRREALRLVESYSKFIYDLGMEEFIMRSRVNDDEEKYEAPEDDDVDPDEDFEL